MALPSLKDLCTPRKSVFDKTRHDVVLDLSNLIAGTIKAADFFEENFVTDGMKTLLNEAFRRFAEESEQSVFVLSQAMGGGKTHNMIALGLLAAHPEIRKKVSSEIGKHEKLGPVRVVGFSGRQSDEPLGIWGSIADQLGKKDEFKGYYSPLSAPGPNAWVNLLKGTPLLILLDELPPYFQAAKSKTIGHSDLAEVTTTALANLLVAVSKPELKNVCVVISDLKATYQQGSQMVQQALQNFGNEVGRTALKLEPVALNSNEIYDILRTRLFEKLPDTKQIQEIAQAYADSVKAAKQMDITNASPEQYAQNIKDSFPFHFAIRDLYARFRENEGFQQTRGLIRLMRILVARLYDKQHGRADKIHLIHAHDFDLNDGDTFSEFTNINPTLTNAISHDIADKGKSVAEVLDANLTGTDAQDACKLLVIASLANIPNATLGLALSETISNLCAPGRDIARVKDALSHLQTKAWYLHTTRDGKLYFKNVQNLVAKLKSASENYNRETVLRELRGFLSSSFTPQQKDCFQEVLALPPIDEIQTKLRQDRNVLVICEPHTSGGLHPDLKKFYDDLDFKNRILFLAGSRQTLETLLSNSSEFKAINWILEEMEKEKVPENDPQRVNATQMLDKIRLNLLSAARETFTTLHYPTKSGLMSADFEMKYSNNQYNGEQQIRDTLKNKYKFTEDIASEGFKNQCEAKLFTTQKMQWAEIKKRAAAEPSWPWHKPDALDALKDSMIHKDQWRESGNWIERGPFPQPVTEVRVQEIDRDDATGECTLRITPVHGDIVYCEVNSKATTASAKVTDFKGFKTRELVLSFLCVDSSGVHEMGAPAAWKNKITLQGREYQQGKDKMVELKSAPSAPIKYTSDGSHPSQGASYEGPFAVPKGAQVVLAEAEKNGIVSLKFSMQIDWKDTGVIKVDPKKPALWKREQSPKTTKDSYELLRLMEKYQTTAGGVRINLAGLRWAELNFDPDMQLDSKQLGDFIDTLRKVIVNAEVAIEAPILAFPTGQQLLDWVAEVKTELKINEVEQRDAVAGQGGS